MRPNKANLSTKTWLWSRVLLLPLLAAAPFNASAEDNTPAKPRLFKLQLENCAKSNTNLCRFRVDENILKKYGLGGHRTNLEIYQGSTLVMTSKSFSLGASNGDEDNLRLRFIVPKGVWEVSLDERRNIISKKIPLLAMIYPKNRNLAQQELAAKTPAAATPAPLTREEPAAAAPVYMRAAYPQDERDDYGYRSHRYADERRPAVERERERDEVNAGYSRQFASVSPQDSKSTPSTYERFEKWASGQTAQNKPTIALSARMGSPHSPTSQQGGLIEFFPTPIFRLGVGGGTYSSASSLDSCAGSIKYANTTAQGALTIGGKGGSVKFGLGLTQINARYGAGKGICESDKGKKILKPEEQITRSYTKTYLGMTPSMGLSFESDSFYMLSIDYGMFIPLGGDYRSAPNAPYNPFSGKASKVSSTKGNWLALGLGIGF